MKFNVSVEDLLQRLRKVSSRRAWNLPREAYAQLAATAPDLPANRLALRSLRIRQDKGTSGVLTTFLEHQSVLKWLYDDEFVVWEEVRPPRLHLSKGDDTHKPTLEWVVIRLDNFGRPGSPVDVGLADELLVLAWLYPELLDLMTAGKFPGLLASGYTLDVNGCQGNMHLGREPGEFNHRVVLSAKANGLQPFNTVMPILV